MVHRRTTVGFTLIEMMVAITIFSIVLVVSVGSILAIVEANRKAQSLKSIVNNLNFTMETISRNIRVGTVLHCFNTGGPSVPDNVDDGPQDCPGGGNGLALEAQFGDSTDPDDQVIYKFYDGKIWRYNEGPGGPGIPLTANEVTIEHMEFFVDGNTIVAAGDQPRVRMTVKGFAKVGRARTEFNLQTTVTQRILDLPSS